MFLVRHPDSKNWFVAPEAWTAEDTRGYLAFNSQSREQLIALASLLNNMESLIARLDSRLTRIQKIINGEYGFVD